MDAIKTTFYLSDALRVRLKQAAARRDTTVTALLVEGAERVLADERRIVDRGEVARRAKEAREALRRGLYSGPAMSDRADELAYGVAVEPAVGSRRRRATT